MRGDERASASACSGSEGDGGQAGAGRLERVEVEGREVGGGEGGSPSRATKKARRSARAGGSASSGSAPSSSAIRAWVRPVERLGEAGGKARRAAFGHGRTRSAGSARRPRAATRRPAARVATGRGRRRAWSSETVGGCGGAGAGRREAPGSGRGRARRGRGARGRPGHRVDGEEERASVARPRRRMGRLGHSRQGEAETSSTVRATRVAEPGLVQRIAAQAVARGPWARCGGDGAGDLRCRLRRRRARGRRAGGSVRPAAPSEPSAMQRAAQSFSAASGVSTLRQRVAGGEDVACAGRLSCARQLAS